VARPRRSRTSPAVAPDRPELFIGLVAATGTDTDAVAEKIRTALLAFNYACEQVRLSSLLRQFFPDLPTDPTDRYIQSHQDAGNELREKLHRPDALALAGVTEILTIRAEKIGDSQTDLQPLAETAYLIRSLKTPDEVTTFRDLYGDRFILISAYAPRDARVTALARRIADDSTSRIDETLARSKAEAIVARDEAEEANEYGQNVRSAFPLADFFVDARTPAALEQSIERCFDIFFGDPFRTPTRDESGMFYAEAAGVRSAELGRQVGAAITTEEGALVAVGTNDVAKRGGGLYWEGDEHDDRDFKRGVDTNEVRRTRIVEELLARMKEEHWLRPERESATAATLLKVFDDTRLASLIEFGRAVHAEMAAMTDAAYRGVSVRGCTLYTSTFPCHLCARHVVAAGIERLVYIHPYPKSLAAQLYEDTIAVDQQHAPAHVIEFQPFVGVAPTRYLDLFRARQRKLAGGTAVQFVRTDARPKFIYRPFSELAYLLREQVGADSFNDALSPAGLKPTPRRRRKSSTPRTPTTTRTRKPTSRRQTSRPGETKGA